MAYRHRMQGDYRAGHQGGFGLVSLATGLGGAMWRGLRKRFAGPAIATAATVLGGAVAFPGAGRPRLPVPLPGGARLDIGSLLPGGKPAFLPSSQVPELCPKGYQLNKSSYFLKSGQFVPRGTKLVRIRTRNFANGKSLRKAIGRVQGFERLVKRSRKSLRKLSKI